MANTPSGFKFPILTSNQTYSNTVVDMADIFVRKELFLNAGLWAWGYNNFGELGNGTVTLYSSPIQVGILTNWKQVSCGQQHTAAVKTNGTLWTWGYNFYGQLGNNTTTIHYSSPIQIGSGTNWKQVACCGGGNYTAAIKTDGTLWAWGDNRFGQLGNNDPALVNQNSPVQVGTLTNWKQVACGYYHIEAIKTDGTLWAWGYNAYGQLGNGTTGIFYSSPIQVGTDTNWKQVSCGNYMTAAIKTNGTLWTWGVNGFGQLGNNDPALVNQNSPVQVGTLTNWKQVACGQQHIAVIKTDSSLWTWGFGSNGALGNSTSGINYSSPIQIGSLTNWKQVACGYQYTAVIQSNGTVWTWGWNSLGNLGNGTIGILYSSPIQIGSLTNWKQVACGNYYVLAIQTDQ